LIAISRPRVGRLLRRQAQGAFGDDQASRQEEEAGRYVRRSAQVRHGLDALGVQLAERKAEPKASTQAAEAAPGCNGLLIRTSTPAVVRPICDPEHRGAGTGLSVRFVVACA
jgi:hypothetical protein